MFALIISILAIILSVALAGISVYYGGDAFLSGSERAAVATLTNQGYQLEAALTLFRSDYGASAEYIALENNGLADWKEALIEGGYLRQVPVSQFNPFEIINNTIISTDITLSICRAFEDNFHDSDSNFYNSTTQLFEVIDNAPGITGCLEVPKTSSDGSTSNDVDEINLFYYKI